MPTTPPIRSWVLPDEPASVRLMSTIWADAEGIHDDLAGPADLDEAVTVLNEHAAELPPPAIAASPSGLRRAKEAPASGVTTGLAAIAQQAVALLADRG